MLPRVRLAVGLVLLIGWCQVASGQRTVPSAPPPEKPLIDKPKTVSPSPVPAAEERVSAAPEKAGGGVLSDLLTVFIFVALVAGIVIAIVLAVALFFRLRTAEDPLFAVLEDAWVQGRLRELEAAPPEPEAGEEAPVEQAEAR